MNNKQEYPLFIQEADGIQEYQLKNGLKVLLVHNPSAPVVTIQVVYHVGSRNEGVGYTGSTHFLEHMLFKGTPSFNKSKGTQIASVLNRIGANFNATTWVDRTTYYETIPAEHLDLALQIEAERMQHAFIRDNDRQAEMTVVRNELERDENEPDSIMWKHLFAHAFLAHPYHHPTIGWHSDVEGVPTARLRKFYKEYYHPNNASLILVGDYQEKEALATIQRHFGVIPASPKAIPPMYTQEFAQEGERRFVIRRPGQLGILQMAWHVPPMEHQDSVALDVLQDILSEGVSSRLYQALVEEQVSLYAGAFNLQLRDPGLFIVHSKLASDASHTDVEAKIKEVIQKLQTHPPDDNELQKVKNQVRAAFSYQRHGAQQLSSVLAEFEAAASWRHLVNYLPELDKITAEDIQRVAKTYLHQDNCTVGSFIPGEAPKIDLNQRAELRSIEPTAATKSRKATKGKIQRTEFGQGILLSQENHLDNTISIQGQIRAGTIFNPDLRHPLAQLTASMLKNGTKRFDKLALADHLALMGTSLNFRLGTDSLTFSLRCLSEHFEPSLQVLQEVLHNPVFPAHEFDKLKKQRIDRLKQRLDSTDAMAYDLLYRQLYPEGHYHHQLSVADLIQATEETSLDDIKSYYAQTYGAGGLTVSGVGNLDTQSLHDFFSQNFQNWAKNTRDWPSIPDVALQKQGARLIYAMPDKANVSIVMGHQTSLKRTDPEYFAAMLGNHVLGQSSLSSRLGIRIRDELGLTYGIYSFFPELSRYAGPWAVSVSTHPDNVEAAVSETRKVVSKFVQQGMSDKELEEAKSSLIGSYLVNLTTHDEIASRLLQIERYQLGLNYFQTRAKLIKQISSDDICNALQKHIHPERLSVAIAGKHVGAQE